jgi:hypothetical protein
VTTLRATRTGAVTTVFTPLRTGLEQLPLVQLPKAKEEVPVRIRAIARIKFFIEKISGLFIKIKTIKSI